jgi:hypothetical protein
MAKPITANRSYYAAHIPAALYNRLTKDTLAAMLVSVLTSGGDNLAATTELLIAELDAMQSNGLLLQTIDTTSYTHSSDTALDDLPMFNY